MILPTKYVSPARSLLGIGGLLLTRLDRPRTVPALWDAIRAVPEVGTFERFALALDLLYMLGAVGLENGLLHRREVEELRGASATA